MPEMTDREERAYIAGRKAAFATILRTAMNELASGRTLESLTLERAETVAALREICEEFGDNDWLDGLHLADVVRKHLGRHLEER